MAPRLLFVPVSGAFGMGEYARCLNLALAFKAHRPDAEIHFAISAQAPYATQVPFESTRLPSSPTFHTPEMRRLVLQLQPHVVVFDNAGRTAQLAAAVAAGAKIVYISARPRQRRKAFRLRWMRMIEEHWIAYPEFVAGSLSRLERLKLRGLKRPQIRYLDCLLPALSEDDAAVLMRRTGVVPGDYVLVVPGGGTGHPGALDAVEMFRQAAALIASEGVSVVVVQASPLSAASETAPPSVTCLGLQALPELIALIRGARAMLSNGGGTLIQAIACHTVTVSVAIAADQAARIACCEGRGLTLSAALDPAAMASSVIQLFGATPLREQMRKSLQSVALRDASATAVQAFDGLLPRLR